MAKKRYNVCYPREYKRRDGEKGTEYVRVGTAWPLNDQDGMSLELSVPIVLRAGAQLLIFEVKPREGADPDDGDYDGEPF